MSLKDQLVKLGTVNPDLREHLRPILAHVTRTAGWWGSGPLEGDGSLDLISFVEEADPLEAANLVKKELKSRSFTTRYSAMGVWDLVMSSKVEAYVEVFKHLTRDVVKAAHIDDDDEWAEDETVVEFLNKYYSRGKASGKLRGRFNPKALGGWYIARAETYGSDLVELTIQLSNEYTNERKEVSETIDAPVYFSNVDVMNYGGKGSSQQSVLLSAEGEDGSEWEVQVDIDPKTGEIKNNYLDFEGGY